MIVWLPLLHEILDNMCIVTVCEPVCDIIKFEINLIFLIQESFFDDLKVKQKFKNLENEIGFNLK